MPAGAVVPIVPMRDLVLFPQMIAPIFVGATRPSGPSNALWRRIAGFSCLRSGAQATMIQRWMRYIR
jgi:hypothetical protein